MLSFHLCHFLILLTVEAHNTSGICPNIRALDCLVEVLHTESSAALVVNLFYYLAGLTEGTNHY